jgi:hypothetical protein
LRPWPFAAASALALAAAGCNLLPKPHRAVTRLTCPATQGALTRVSVSPNGKSCRYRTDHGGEVELRLVPVKNGVAATLSGLETEALAMRPSQSPPAASAQSASPAPKADLPSEDEDSGATEAEDDVDIDLPGLHIRTRGDAANIRLGGLQVDAGGAGAVVRKTWDVRLRGEATSHEKRGVRALFIKVDGGENGDSGVGYQVAGPKAGPLTAALVRWSKGDSEDLYEDVRKLVRDNGGA